MEPLTAIEEVEAERGRQIAIYGWTPEHDDEHESGEMATAAVAYIHWGAGSRCPHVTPPSDWPWEGRWWKPKSRRRDLIRAAALLVAEIERLDRFAASIGQRLPTRS